jgi:iron complex outermembrane receptor protein
LTYRNFGNVNLWGLDAALEYLATDRLRLFGSISYVSDDFFDNTELREDDANLAVALNAPTLKASGGFDYLFPFGFSLRAAGRYVEEFPVITGPFVGTVRDYLVLDAGIGFDFGRQISGLRLDATAQNLLTFVEGEPALLHREFVGAPKIGRLVMARLVYTF